MNTFATKKMITAKDILEERETARRAGLLAHSSNSLGLFLARPGCICYTCRDLLDPSGEQDALEANKEMKPSLRVSIPTPRPASSACPNSPHPPPPSQDHKPVCCQPTPLHLPIPPRAHRLPTSNSSESEDLLSPISLPGGALSPTNFSFNFTIQLTPSSSTSSSYQTLEKDIVPKMQRLLDAYQAELLEVEKNYETTDRMDEIATLDEMWNELDRKIDTTRQLLKQIKKKIV